MIYLKRTQRIILHGCIALLLFPCLLSAQDSKSLNNQKLDGYRGIWFELNQKYEHGDKYSGGLGTYTAKHIPLAVYAPAVDKTFFVYGGTTDRDQRHLLCMIGEYDHGAHLVSRPTVVYDKMGVDDPHDDPTILIDEDGYIWVFVSGRGNLRKGIKLRSNEPYDINAFTQVSMEEFAYPQIWNTENGFFHFFTKYTGVRELYFETSSDGFTWTDDVMIAGIRESPDKKSGHYQVSNAFHDGKIIGTFFNRHRDGHPDTRTDLYYIQTRDFGRTWEDIYQKKAILPLTMVDIPQRIIDYQSRGKNVYMKDMGFDPKGNPVCLYITSGGHEPGPENKPYQWLVTRWNGRQWKTHDICESDHNYDMGSLYLSDSTWMVVGPTETGPQLWGTGGEIAIWTSRNKGRDWVKQRDVTRHSELNNSYVRRPLNAREPFCFFWASGNAHEFSISELYFGDFNGDVWKLPYTMEKDFEQPLKIKF
jgi:hypothetical protein